jgi:hypothetical protein
MPIGGVDGLHAAVLINDAGLSYSYEWSCELAAGRFSCELLGFP